MTYCEHHRSFKGWSNVIRLLHHDRGLEYRYMAHLETWWDMLPQGQIKLNHNNFPFSLVDNSKIKIQDIQKYNSLNWKHSNTYVYPISVVFLCFYFWITVLHFQRRLKVLQLKHFGLNWGIPTSFDRFVHLKMGLGTVKNGISTVYPISAALSYFYKTIFISKGGRLFSFMFYVVASHL